MTHAVVDNQRQPKPEPMPRLDFRNLDLPDVFEVPLEMWLDAAGFPDTVRMDLDETNRCAG